MVLSPTRPAPEKDIREAVALGLAALCDWAAGRMGEPLPAAVRRRAALVLADDTAAMVAAAAEPQVRAAQGTILRAGGQEAAVFSGARLRGGREAAAAANGVAVTWAELDEGYRAIPCHAGAYILPALLAEAEADDHPIEDVLRALALAYEITARIARAFPFGGLTVHPHGAFNAIGAAAGLGLLRRLDVGTLRDALTSASTLVCPGPFNHAFEGALVRNLWTSLGATAGFRAADLAPLGIAGLEAAPYDVFVTNLGCRAVPVELTDGLGEADWAIAAGYHKLHACCQYAHSAVEAALELAAAGLRPDDIATIEVETHARGLALDVVRPATVLAAKFSMPHIMAAVAGRGSAGADSFTAETLADPRIAALRGRVRMRPHDDVRAPPHDRPAVVHWLLRDGTRLTAACASARGGADQPFGEGELFDKFAALTAPALPAAGAVLRALVEDGPRREGWRSLVASLTA